MKELMVFNNAEFGQVRTTVVNGEPWFVGKDVADVLGYAKPRNAIATHVDEDDKKDAPIQGNLGGTQKMTIINESGVYALIFGSKLPTTKAFKRWITSEVLPSIRKTGSYSVAQKQDSYLIEDPIKRAERWIEEKKHTLALEQKVAEQQPKADYYDELVDREHLTGIRDTAKELHIKERVFINWLLDNKYLYRDAKNILKPYSTKMDLFTEKDFKNKNNKHSGVRTLITLKGKDFFRKACVGLKVDA